MTLWAIFWFVSGDSHWWTILFNHYGAFLLFLIIPLGIATALLRQWRYFLALVVPIIFTFYQAAAYLRPTFMPGDLSLADQQSTNLSVLTFNVLLSNGEYEQISSHLKTYKADLVALQEVSDNLFDYLNAELRVQYPYSLKSSEPDRSATALFSRLPVEEMYVVDLGEIRPAIVARTSVDGHKIKFISAHLFYYHGWWRYPLTEIPARIEEITDSQHEQVHRIETEVMRHNDDIVIMGCDCNAPETSNTRQMLDQFLTNSARTTGWVLPQPDLPSLGPFYHPQRIDYIFYRGAVEPLSVYTIYDSAGSDHRPVWATFRLR